MEGMQLIGCVVLAGIVAHGAGGSYQAQTIIRDSALKFHPQQDPPCKDCVHLNNCGPASHNISGYLTPKTFVPNVPISLFFEMVAPCDWNGGKVVLKAFLPENPDQPIIEVDQHGDCAGANKYYSSFKCPAKKGDTIRVSYKRKLKQLPEGGYILQAEVYNDNNQQFVCIRAAVEVKKLDGFRF